MGQMLAKSKEDAPASCIYIFKAVEAGNLSLLKHFVKLKSLQEVEAIRNDDKKTLLHTAVLHHRLQCVQFLLELGIDANSFDAYGNTPLLEIVGKISCGNACQSSHSKECLEVLIQLLVKYKADINVTTSVNRTVLLKSIIHRHHVAELLLSNGADPNISDDDGLLPIHVCATYAHLPLLKEIISRGSEIDGQDHKGRTALYYSVLAGHQDIFDELMRHSCDCNKGTTYGYPLQTAIIKCRLEMVRALLRNGVDVQCRIVECRQSYSRVREYLNLALIVTHFHLNNSKQYAAQSQSGMVETMKRSLSILYLVIQAVGESINVSKNIFIKTPQTSLSEPHLLPCKRTVAHILHKLSFLHEMSRNSKPVQGLPKLDSDVDKHSLQNLCRMRIRKLIAATGTNVVYAVEYLNCPLVLKDIILLKDIMCL